MLNNDSVWAKSLAGDSSTHRGQSFFDMRLRICYRGSLFNLHLVAIPMFDRHTAVIIFNMLTKFLDMLYANWRTKLIDMSSDIKRTMINRLGGLSPSSLSALRTMFYAFGVRRIRSTLSLSRLPKTLTSACASSSPTCSRSSCLRRTTS
jgi:hypothetical protein